MTKTALSLLLATIISSASAQDVYNRARAVFAAKDTTTAFGLFQEALKSGQKPSEANYYLGLISFRRGHIDDAIKYLTASVKIDDEYVDALKILGEAYIVKNDPRNALKAFRMAAKEQPKNASVAVGIGMALLAIDSTDAAVIQLTKAKELDPENPAIYAAMGDAFAKQGVNVMAITNYQKATELAPKSFEYHLALARFYVKQRQYNEAIKSYDAAEAINPQFPDPHCEEGEILFKAAMSTDKERDRRSFFQYALDPLGICVKFASKNFDATFMYAKALVGTGSDSLGLVVATSAVRLDSSKAETWRVYLNALVAREDFKGAERALKALERRGALEASDYQVLGDMYYGLKDDEKASQFYYKAIAADSTNCSPLFNLGSIIMRKQDYAEAARIFELKIRCDPRSLAAYINAGASYMTIKNYPRALELLRKTIELKPDFYQGLLWVARALTAMDSLDQAVAVYDEVLKIIGNPPPANKRKDAGEAHYLKGVVYFSKTQYSRAIDSFQKAINNGYENASIYLTLGQAIYLTVDPKEPAADNRKKIEDAIKYFRKSNGMDSKNPQTHLWLGNALIAMRVEGDNDLNAKLKEEACAELKTVLRLDPKNEDAKKAANRIGCN